jgi:cell wall assembly regulator SMI1
MVQACLDINSESKQIEMDSDVVKLLQKLHEMSHSTMGKHEPNWALVTVLRQLFTMQQQKHDTVNNYYLKISSSSQMLQSFKPSGVPSIHPNWIPLSMHAEEIARASEAT